MARVPRNAAARPAALPPAPIEIPPRTWTVWSIGVSLLFGFIRLLALHNSTLNLLPDEAQYWSWSRHLEFGYFSKPPMIAWLIAATTAAIGGNEEWAVRLSAPWIHAATAIVISLIGRALFSARVGFWSAVLYGTLPGVIYSGLVISTDVPLLFFWALALLSLIEILTKPRLGWAVLLGAAIGLGFLSKYAMGYFLLGIVVLAIVGPRAPFKAALRHLILAVIMALAILAPNLVWNASHGWATVGHTAANADWTGQGGAHLLETLSFAGAQFGVFGPILLGALIVRAVTWRRDPPPPAERFLLAFALPVLILMVLQSGISRAHANWAAVSYVAGTVLVVGWLDRIRKFWPVGVSLLLHGALFAGFTLLFAGAIPNMLPKTLDIFNQMRGWGTLADLVWKQMGAMPPGTSLAAEDRQVFAELDYYTRARPFPLAMAVGTGKVGNQYEMDDAIDAQTGAHALLVSQLPDRTDILDRFAAHSLIQQWTISAGRGRFRHYFVYDASGFRGN